MKIWDVGKEGLSVAYIDVPIDKASWKYIPSKVYESPKGRFCIYVYGDYDPNNMVDLSNFMVLEDSRKPKILLQTDYRRIYCWRSNGMVSWSADEKMVSITVVPVDEVIKGYYEAKLLVDTGKKKYSIIPLAGATSYHAKFLKGGKYAINHVNKGGTDHQEFPKGSICVSKLKWLPLEKFDKITKLFFSGYFGDLVGYNVPERNIHFKDSAPAWPYK